MIAIGQLIFYTFILYPFLEIQYSQHLQRIEVLVLIVLSTVLVAAAGNLINDYYDIHIDRINKYTPNQYQSMIHSKRKLLFVYFVFNVLALVLSIIVDFLNAQFLFFPFLLTISVLLWLYSYKLKCFNIFGNVLVAILVVLSFIVICFIIPINELKL